MCPPPPNLPKAGKEMENFTSLFCSTEIEMAPAARGLRRQVVGERQQFYMLSLSLLRGQLPRRGNLSLLLDYIRSRQFFQTSILRKKSVVRVIHRRCLGGGRLGGETLDIRPQRRGGPQLAAAHSAAAVETAPAVSVCHSSSPSAQWTACSSSSTARRPTYRVDSTLWLLPVASSSSV